MRQKYEINVAETAEKTGLSKAAIYARLKRGTPVDAVRSAGQRQENPNSVAYKCRNLGIKADAVLYAMKKGMTTEEAIAKVVAKKKAKEGKSTAVTSEGQS